jgi:hypothetical protein
MNSLVADRLFQCFVHESMLLEQPFALKSRRYNDQLPMIAAAGQVLGSQTDIGSDFPKKSLICSGVIMSKSLPVRIFRLQP